MDSKRMVLLGLLLAGGVVLHIVESLLPFPIPVPGVKLGLANIITLLALVLLGVKESLALTVARVLLGSLAAGTFLGPSFWLSVSGGLGSLVVMAILYRRNWFSVLGISVAGAVTHSTCQILAATVVVSAAGVLWWLPWLSLIAIPTGILTGLVALFTLQNKQIHLLVD